MKSKLPKEIPIVELKQRVSDFIESFPGGHEAVAAILNIRLSTFRNRFSEKNGTGYFTIGQLETLEDLSEDKFLADYFNDRIGRVSYKKPDAGALDSVELHDLRMRVDQRKAALSMCIGESISNDGYIDEKEAIEIIRKHNRCIAAETEYRHSLIEIYRKKG